MSTVPSQPVEQNLIPWLLERLEQEAGADPLIDALRTRIQSVSLGRVRDGLRGKWVGHPVHPLMVQVPIGSWLSAAVLDLCPGRSREAGLLIGVGLAAVGPAVLTGAVDWAELGQRQQRVGIVHALANTMAAGLYAASLVCRVKGHPTAGRAFGFVGLTAVGAGGLLGGHMTFHRADGADHAEEALDVLP
ncbi:DUF2231 domain-containing protein [Streptomyces fructofermentans]|uniref:DUF2231 domain-containing protein n=1 Tax=Streptomyces fructofermentans TaxID=152141 RepID=UPI0037887165